MVDLGTIALLRSGTGLPIPATCAAYCPQSLHSLADVTRRAIPLTVMDAQATSERFKVLFLSHFPLQTNGSGQFTLSMARFMAANGAEVGVLFAGHRFAENLPGVSRQYLLPFSPQYEEPLPGAAKANLPVFDSNPASTNGKRFRDMTSAELAAYAAGFMKGMSAAVKDMQPDVVVVNHAWTGAIAAQRLDIPYVVFCHGSCINHVVAAYPHGPSGDPDPRYPGNLGELVFPAIQAAGKVLTASHDVGGRLPAAYGIPDEKVAVIPHGFDKEVFHPRVKIDRAAVLARLGIEDFADATHIVDYTGRMGNIKGVDIMIRAAQLVLQKMPGVRFVLAGGGGELEAYQALASELHIAGAVRFIGHRATEDLAMLHGISDLSAVPSRSELFGIAALEAAGTGTPVIASDIPGLNGVVTGNIGCLFPRADHAKMAEVMIGMLDADLKRQHGRMIARYTHSTYGWELSGAKFLSMLKGIAYGYQAGTGR